MIKSKKKLGLILFLGIGFGIISGTAQNTILTSGGNASGSGGSSSYSLGQINYTSQENSENSVSAGVQQVYIIEIADAVNEENHRFNLNAYPNPTANTLWINADLNNDEKIVYALFDTNGKIIKKENLVQKETKIDMIDLPSATYYLKIIGTNQQEIKTFKILKTL
ncbi:MAG: T9SS type A sorting domain-containing protein [Salibacteraceae bacterium]